MFQRIERVLAGLAIASALLLGACSNPCRALSDQICDCKPNQPEQSACRERVRLSENELDEVTEAQAQACEQHLDTCTCEAVDDGDLAACGLSKTE